MKKHGFQINDRVKWRNISQSDIGTIVMFAFGRPVVQWDDNPFGNGVRHPVNPTSLIKANQT